MASPIVLEVCVDSVASAVASEEGGAQRIELCSNLAEGGVTPSAGLIAMVRKRIAIPLHVLIRPRAGSFCYTRDEFEVMKRDIALAKQVGADCIVCGILDRERRVDVARMREIIALARPLSITFHRAFDASHDLRAALEDVVATGADRILTSGGAQTAETGADTIANLMKVSAGRIGIIACGTIRAGNVASIIEKTGVREVHAELSTRAPDGDTVTQVYPETVTEFLHAAARAAPV